MSPKFHLKVKSSGKVLTRFSSTMLRLPVGLKLRQCTHFNVELLGKRETSKNTSEQGGKPQNLVNQNGRPTQKHVNH